MGGENGDWSAVSRPQDGCTIDIWQVLSQTVLSGYRYHVFLRAEADWAALSTFILGPLDLEITVSSLLRWPACRLLSAS